MRGDGMEKKDKKVRNERKKDGREREGDGWK